MAMSFRYPNLVSLGGVELTDEGRGPINEKRDERGVTIELASGKRRKYIKSVLRSWDINWEMMAMDGTKTIDGKAARNELRSLAESGSPLIFTFKDGHNPLETYTVFVVDYTESMTLRRGEDSRFSVSLSLEEQG